jgi:hypothetical protein
MTYYLSTDEIEHFNATRSGSAVRVARSYLAVGLGL